MRISRRVGYEMRKTIILFVLLLISGIVKGQWVVSDPTNLAQSIVNSDGSHLDDIGQHAQQFSGDDEDLQARETVL